MSDKTMKCPNCGADVESGYLFCPKCLEEVPWVPEYNTVETILTKHDYTKKKRIQKVKKQLARQNLSKKRRRFIKVSVVLLTLAVVLGGGMLYFNYRNANSYAYQYHKAEKSLESGAYDSALEYVDRALTLEGNHAEAYRLLSRILDAEGDLKGAIKVMESCMMEFPNSEVIYGELIALYEENGDTDKIKNLLDNCRSTDIKEQFHEYITPDPVISMATGAYSQEIQVTISGEVEELYYTLDGTEPDRDSEKYEESITVGEGTTELNVIAYSSLGIPSDVIYRKYIVAMETPDAPVISPEETYFEVDTEITISVPDGCICYYAFDQIPNSSSTRYTGPVNMPEGTHTLYAFLKGPNGKESEMSSRTYQLVY